ncbi:MAG: protein-glutamate methylesterase/protein-glutamine glutaminase [Planctomycetota bacterium]
MTPLRVLIVDDSRIFRKSVETALGRLDSVEVVGSVFNGRKALEFLETHRVDLVTLDVQMPVLDGLDTLNEIRRRDRERGIKTGVVMLSALSREGAPETIEALARGAFDFLEKPTATSSERAIDALVDQLDRVIRALRSSDRISPTTGLVLKPPPAATSPPAGTLDAGSITIAIGCSTGGPRALHAVLPALCRPGQAPVLVVQHMPPGFTRSLAENLDRRCEGTVQEAREAMCVEPGHAYIAPGGQHLLVRRDRTGLRLGLNEQPPEHGCRPCADVLFRSCATACGARAVGVVLTGMGEDGTAGLRAMRRAGARILAQDKETSVVWGMPGTAVKAGIVDEVVPLAQLPDAIARLAGAAR